jgi:hypothetical protein
LREPFFALEECIAFKEASMTFKTLILGAVAGAAALVLASPASAYIACNSFGDCWHTESRYSRPGLTFEYHPDDWYFHRTWGDRSDRYRYRAYHEGRGYWGRNGVWITF